MEPTGEDVQEDEELEEEDPPIGVSFFMQGPRADELVCRAVWNMFVKASNGNGFTVSGKDAAAMAGKKRGEMLDVCAKAIREFEDEHGRAPTARELFESVGADVGVSIGNVRMAAKRLAEMGRATGLSDTRFAPGKPSQRPRKERAKTPKPAPAAERRASSTTTSDDPVLTMLVSKRDELRKKADALDVAITALEAAS